MMIQFSRDRMRSSAASKAFARALILGFLILAIVETKIPNSNMSRWLTVQWCEVTL